ncbi:hypothetical protein FORC79_3903 [Salmonella enterica subsp. enterica serovar Typhimurium]|nr:hypothetical protein FORC79_3903 [Salmonella enterica subsp. enterica serovar Typhimurium]
MTKAPIFWRRAWRKTKMPFTRHQRIVTSIFKAFSHGRHPISQAQFIAFLTYGIFIPPHTAYTRLLTGVPG